MHQEQVLERRCVRRAPEMDRSAGSLLSALFASFPAVRLHALLHLRRFLTKKGPKAGLDSSSLDECREIPPPKMTLAATEKQKRRVPEEGKGVRKERVSQNRPSAALCCS